MDKQSVSTSTCSTCWRHLGPRRPLPEGDVGTEQRVVEEEEFSVSRFENPAFLITDDLSQQLRVNQMFLLGGQQLQKKGGSSIKAWRCRPGV